MLTDDEVTSFAGLSPIKTFTDHQQGHSIGTVETMLRSSPQQQVMSIAVCNAADVDVCFKGTWATAFAASESPRPVRGPDGSFSVALCK